MVALHAPVDTLPRLTVPAGTILWHGTNCRGDNALPDPPAWFCFTDEKAWGWAGWASPPAGRELGPRKVLRYETAEDITVFDIVAFEDCVRLRTALTGDPEATTGAVVETILAHGLPGWRGPTEIFLPTLHALRPLDATFEDGAVANLTLPA